MFTPLLVITSKQSIRSKLFCLQKSTIVKGASVLVGVVTAAVVVGVVRSAVVVAVTPHRILHTPGVLFKKCYYFL